MKAGTIAAFVAATLLSSAADAQAPEVPSWMAGCWEGRLGDRWTEECWTVPRAGQMLGSGRTGDEGGVRSFEFMRIESDGEGLAFRASPGGEGWTSFAASADPGGGVTFLNPRNDYPQRVRYWREGGELKAEVSLLDGSEAVQFAFRPMSGQ